MEADMSSNRDRNITTSGGGFFHDVAINIKLVLKLMADPRVPFWLKLLPIGSVIYLLIPDIILGPIDDAAIIWLGTYLFIELCPPEIVKEHMDNLSRVVPGEWYDPADDEENIVDAEYRVEE
jgi:hypothetical protein